MFLIMLTSYACCIETEIKIFAMKSEKQKTVLCQQKLPTFDAQLE